MSRASPEIQDLSRRLLAFEAARDKRDGKLLAGEEGRLRIVVADEKRSARWVRQVITLTIKRAE